MSVVNRFNVNNTPVTLNVGIYDVSAYNNGAVFESLSDLLSNVNLDTLIPLAVRKGGMSIKFIQGTVSNSDNKYVQYRLIADEWSTNNNDWTIADEGVYVENPEYVYVKTDAEGKILWAIKVDGSIYYGAGVPQQMIDYVNEKIAELSFDYCEDIVAFLSDYLGSDTTLKVMIDSINERIPEIIENPEYLEVTTDSEDKVLEGIRTDGTKDCNIPINKLNLTESGIANLVSELESHGMSISVTQEELDTQLSEYSKTSVSDSKYAAKSLEDTVESQENDLHSIQQSLNAEIHEREVNDNAIIASIAGGIGTVPAALLPIISRNNPSSSNGATEEAIINYVDSSKEYVTPEMYGAVGDGITNDTNAVNQAIANGSVVVLNGIYKVVGLSITHSVKIIGGELKADLTSLGQDKNIITSTTPGIDIIFEGVDFNGDGITPVKTTNATDNLIKIWNANSVKFIGCKIHNSVGGVEGEDQEEVAKRKGVTVSLYNNKYVSLDRCEIYNNCLETFFIGGYKAEDNYAEFGYLSVTNCYSHDNQNSQALFTVMNLQCAIVDHNIFTTNGTSFYNLLSSNHVFTNNVFDTCSKRGIGTERNNWVRINNTIVANNIFRNIQDRAIEIGVNGCIIANNTIENCMGIDCSGGIKNNHQYDEEFGLNHIARICPFVNARNTLDDELGLTISDNIVRLRAGQTASPGIIRICGTYDIDTEDVDTVKDVTVVNNKLYSNGCSMTMSPIALVNTAFKNIIIKENYIEGKNSVPLLGFIRIHTDSIMKNMRIIGNVFHQENLSDVSNLVSFRTSRQYSYVQIKNNIKNFNIDDTYQQDGEVSNLSVSDNTIITN